MYRFRVYSSLMHYMLIGFGLLLIHNEIYKNLNHLHLVVFRPSGIQSTEAIIQSTELVKNVNPRDKPKFS